MANLRTWLIVMVGLLLISCLLLVGLGAYAWWKFGQSLSIAEIPQTTTPKSLSISPTRVPPWTPTSAGSPAPTNTLVLQSGTLLPPLSAVAKTPTRAWMYAYGGITPIAPVMRNAIAFSSPFKMVTYPVTGTTLSDIAKSLDANALKEPNEFGNQRYYALTTWYLSSHWEETPGSLGCQVGKANVAIAITMTLPLIDSAVLAPEVASRWDVFINNTLTHEAGHVQLLMDGATDYRRLMGNLSPALTCGILKTQLNDLFKKEYAQMSSANQDYDVRTKHGVTQGAVFP